MTLPDITDEQLASRARQLVGMSRGFARDLRTLRLTSGAEVEEIAQELGVTEDAIRDLERPGGAPDLQLLQAYALTVGIDLELRATPASGHELDIHLEGHDFRDHTLPVRVGENILNPIQRFADAVGPKPAPLAIAALGPGSAVVTLVPHVEELESDEAEDDQESERLDIEVDRAQSGAAVVFRHLLDFFDAAESGADLSPWANRYAPVQDLTRVLSRRGIRMGLTHKSPNGSTRTVTYTEAGQEYFKAGTTNHEKGGIRQVYGRITSLNLAGKPSAKIESEGRPAGAKTARPDAESIEFSSPEALLELHLSLHDHVLWTVKDRIQEDDFGGITTRWPLFLSVGAETPTMPVSFGPARDNQAG